MTSSIRKLKEYDFIELTNEELNKGREYNFQNPLLIRRNHNYFLLYRNDKDETKLNLTLVTGINTFEEIK